MKSFGLYFCSFLLLALAFGAFGEINDECDRHSNCESCIADPKCGFVVHEDNSFNCLSSSEFNCNGSSCDKTPHGFFKQYCPVDLHTPLYGRRSIRKYLPLEVSQQTIQEILNDCVWAPTCIDVQPWKFYVVTNQEMLADISRNASAKQTKPQESIFYHAPAVIFIFVEYPKGEVYKPCVDHGLIDGGLAVEALELSAYNRGYGTCTVGYSWMAEDRVRELVGAPADSQYVVAVTLGHPATVATKTRNPPQIKWFE
eukprot:GCRY01001976.1.p1 GENE.GCRY01001976.1~~GCRY01001976.1.p1  ORF type:complete len:281 (+),score=44.05 GCRY01001976.1:77-844(+)